MLHGVSNCLTELTLPYCDLTVLDGSEARVAYPDAVGDEIEVRMRNMIGLYHTGTTIFANSASMDSNRTPQLRHSSSG
jgi:hypothetical protein